MAREFTVIANLLADPEVRDANGKDVLNLRFAENLGYFDKDREWVETGTVIYEAAIWEGGFQGALFDNIADSLHSGDKIVAVVRFRGEGVRAFERKNSDELGAVVEVDIIELGASLKNATVEVTRNKKKGGRKNDDEDDAPRGRSSRGRSRSNDDDDEAPAKGRTSSRSRASKDDDEGDDEPKRTSRSSRSRSNDDDDEAAAPRRGSASRGRSRSSKSDDDAF